MDDWPVYEEPDPETKRWWLWEARTENEWGQFPPIASYVGNDLFDIPRPDWLLPPVLQQRQLSVVAGPSNTFKTFLMVDVAMTLATGAEWAFMSRWAPPRDPVPVLVVEGEGADTIAERAQGWLAHRGADPRNLPDTLMVAKDLTNLYQDYERVGGTVEQLMALVAYEGVQLVVFDTLHATAAGANTNDPEHMNRIVKSMRRIRDEAGAAVCVVHHYNKSGDIGGSNVLFAAMDTVVEVRPDMYKYRPEPGAPEFEEVRGIYVATTKQRRFPVKNLGKLVPKTVRYREAYEDSWDPELDGTTLALAREGESELQFGETQPLFALFDERARGAVDRIFQTAKKGASSKNQLARSAGGKRSTTLELIDRMVEVGLLHVWEDGSLHTLPEIEEL